MLCRRMKTSVAMISIERWCRKWLPAQQFRSEWSELANISHPIWKRPVSVWPSQRWQSNDLTRQNMRHLSRVHKSKSVNIDKRSRIFSTIKQPQKIFTHINVRIDCQPCTSNLRKQSHHTMAIYVWKTKNEIKSIASKCIDWMHLRLKCSITSGGMGILLTNSIWLRFISPIDSVFKLW